MLKIIFIILGTLSLAIGCIGIFVPGLPTTPFVLLTAALYIKSSDRMYNWVIESRIFGKYIKNYQARKGMEISTKLYSIALMWIMIFISTYFFIDNRIVDWIVVAAGILGTITVGFIVPTAAKDKLDDNQI